MPRVGLSLQCGPVMLCLSAPVLHRPARGVMFAAFHAFLVVLLVTLVLVWSLELQGAM